MPREIVLEPFWNSEEPYCIRTAFLDLMLLAAHEAHDIVFDMKSLRVEQGEIITSLEKLAARWKWSRPKVRRYLKALKSVQRLDYQTTTQMTRITISRWASYQGLVTANVSAKVTANVTANVRCSSGSSPAVVRQTSTYNNDKNVKNDENEKKKGENENLKFVRAKKSYEELTEAEKELAAECARFYEQTLKSKIDFNKLAILVYGSEEDKQEYGFGDWQTLRKALGCLSREQLTFKVLHLYYYIWGLSRQKEYVEKIKRMVEESGQLFQTEEGNHDFPQGKDSVNATDKISIPSSHPRILFHPES